MIKLPKYRQCQDCMHKFIIPKSTLKYESHNDNVIILCPKCSSENIAIVKKFSR